MGAQKGEVKLRSSHVSFTRARMISVVCTGSKGCIFLLKFLPSPFLDCTQCPMANKGNAYDLTVNRFFSPIFIIICTGELFIVYINDTYVHFSQIFQL